MPRNLAPLVWSQPPPPPRQRALGREEIVAAAIAVTDEAGPEGVTMKAVAARLGGYSPMALYRYGYSKEGLVDLMLDAAVAEIPVPARPSDDWREDLRALALATRAMTVRHGTRCWSTPAPATIATVHDLAAADGNVPHLTSWLAQPTGPTVDERFIIGLDLLLDGIAGRLVNRLT
ncbi:hypothetical protein GCM10023322_46050 [Rugosimonospora acidiphila]|uniref:HTH tetR-type domain-containing protein n=1 Tax=Rugosimonospora acidiphila TaxID=556531 RepID=A0ABP9S2H2_9ACTN